MQGQALQILLINQPIFESALHAQNLQTPVKQNRNVYNYHSFVRRSVELITNDDKERY